MSALAIATPAANRWEMWRNQALAILALELRKNFITKRGFWIYGLALAPVAIIWIHTIVTLKRGDFDSHALARDTEVLARMFQAFFLRPAVYFGCVGIFTYLFRGEVVERTLHFYFLAPIRKEVLIFGKYMAGLITAVFFFCGSIVLCFAGMYAHWRSHELRAFLIDGPGLGHLLGYVGITALGCMAYGALFLWLGIRYKNPVIPAVSLLFWESLNIFLPSWLKKVSILYYLRSLAPVDPNLFGPGALFAGVADPASLPVALFGVFAITFGLLVLAVKELRRAEISYSSD